MNAWSIHSNTSYRNCMCVWLNFLAKSFQIMREKIICFPLVYRMDLRPLIFRHSIQFRWTMWSSIWTREPCKWKVPSTFTSPVFVTQKSKVSSKCDGRMYDCLLLIRSDCGCARRIEKWWREKWNSDHQILFIPSYASQHNHHAWIVRYAPGRLYSSNTGRWFIPWPNSHQFGHHRQ